MVATREPGGTPLGEAIRELRPRRARDDAPGRRRRSSPRRAPSTSAAVIRPALERGARGRLRPLRRLVGRLPGHRPRARRRARARAQPRRDRRAPARPHVRAATSTRRRRRAPALGRPRPDRARGRRLPPARRRRLPPASPRSSPSASSPSTARSRRTRSPTMSASSFEAFSEQAEAKRLLGAALAEGPAHAYLFHGPPGVGKRGARARVRARAARHDAARCTRTSTSSRRSAR